MIGESGVYSRSEGTVVVSGRNVDVLGFRVVLGFFIVRGKTGKVESSARSGGVGNVGRTRTDTAGAKSSEEGSTVVLVRYSHMGGIGRESDLLKGCRREKRLHGMSRARVKATGEGRMGVRK